MKENAEPRNNPMIKKKTIIVPASEDCSTGTRDGPNIIARLANSPFVNDNATRNNIGNASEMNT